MNKGKDKRDEVPLQRVALSIFYRGCRPRKLRSFTKASETQKRIERQRGKTKDAG